MSTAVCEIELSATLGLGVVRHIGTGSVETGVIQRKGKHSLLVARKEQFGRKAPVARDIFLVPQDPRSGCHD
ncbi:hypothetical protein LshimejAT787_1200300 [Lyophyllum shimeji]|uniref:Uncharacterized protein n=1 Tax=Lyophyllum shimeji TaxID=47721 RepID=A0A9P3UTW4_LYOSH|nr:hypothetical protein LshimejAT787_1200300 [Lyophyllum shimeji]